MDMEALRNAVADTICEDNGGSAFAYRAAIVEAEEMSDEQILEYAKQHGLTV